MNDTTMTRRAVIAGLAALPLARSLALPMVDNDDEPIWDFEIQLGGYHQNQAFVSALARGSVPDGLTPEERYEQDGYGDWMFRWPKRVRVEQMGYRAYCEWMLDDECQEGRVGTVTVREDR